MPDTGVCGQLLESGVCHRQGCTFSHDVFVCQTCRVVYTESKEYERHMRSKLHAKRLRQDDRRRSGASQPVRCTVCDVTLSGAGLYEQHARGLRHQLNMISKHIEADPGPEEVDVMDNQRTCDVCRAVIPFAAWERHVKGLRHKNALKFVGLKSALDESERDKNGITVEGADEAVDFGLVEFAPEGIQAQKIITVSCMHAVVIKFVEARISSRQTSRAAYSNFILSPKRAPTIMTAGSSFKLGIVFDPKSERGRFSDRIELIFEDLKLRQRFCITRPIRATIGVSSDYEALRATAPYIRRKKTHYEDMIEIVPGVPPKLLANLTWAKMLGKHDIPKDLSEMLKSKQTKDLPARIRNAFLPGGFSESTYARYFKILLWIEEDRQRLDLQIYNMTEVTLEQAGEMYELEVAGLAEKRPSVIVTDIIYIREPGSKDTRWLEGHVHVVRAKSVLLRFNRSFHCFRGQRFDVRFSLNRSTLRRMHEAMNTAYFERRTLFPGPEEMKYIRAPTVMQIVQIKTIDRSIMKNFPQMEAITAIVNRPKGSAPFVLFGPPGTGKTITIVEAIRQLLIKNPEYRILACAPSNSAADLIAERLVALGRDQLFRLNAYTRDSKPLPASLRPFTLIEEDKFAIPPKETLMKYRVIVSTCFSASIPSGLGIPRGHFTHIFLDEAGQSTEPESMVSIKTMADTETNIILSGDIKQLGPIVHSRTAANLGLGRSYLGRLMANPLYDERRGHGITVVKLTKNWRSHPDILKYPNEQFYRGDLIPCGDPMMTHSMLRWDCLPNSQLPIIFHGITGKDEQEEASPSFFNIDEASVVKHYVMELYGDRRLRVKPEDIGIVSPYHAQVGKIRKLLSKLPGKMNGRDIKVGSVEEFQGQERRIIIISTVRSTLDKVSFDLRHTLGFVANPRRFNVAITRARALLIVVGDPFVLSLDMLWKSFINFVHTHGSYKGVPLDWDPNETVDENVNVRMDEQRRAQGLSELERLVERVRTEIVCHTENLLDEDELEEVEVAIERPWREDE